MSLRRALSSTLSMRRVSVKCWQEPRRLRRGWKNTPVMRSFSSMLAQITLSNVRYTEEALVLLAVTDVENGAKHPSVAVELGKKLGLKVPTVYKMNMRQVAKIQAEAKDIEGYNCCEP